MSSAFQMVRALFESTKMFVVDVFIIQSTCNPANQNLMELFIMIDAAAALQPNVLPQSFLSMATLDKIAKINSYQLLRNSWLSAGSRGIDRVYGIFMLNRFKASSISRRPSLRFASLVSVFKGY